MQIIDKYIFRQLLCSFIVVLLGLTLLIWLTQSLKMIDIIVTKGVPVSLFLKMTVLVLPSFIQILSPIALFAVALFVYARMQGDKELIVMQSCGAGMKALIKPVLFFAGILALLGYVLSLYLVPTSYARLREMKWQIKNNLSHFVLQPGQFTSVQRGVTVYVKEKLSDGNVKGIIVYDAKNADKISTMIASHGTIFQGDDGINIVFHQGARQELNKKTGQYSFLKFDTYTMEFADRVKAGSRIGDVREQSLKTLLGVSAASMPDAVKYRRYKVEAFKRLTQPLYNIAFVFIAMMGVLYGTYSRRGQSRQLFLAVLAALFVQSFSLGFENLTRKNLHFLVLMALNIILPTVICWFYLFRPTFVLGRKKVWGLIIGTLLAFPVHAVQFDMPKVNENQPVDFEADNIQYDDKENTLTATGQVVISQNGLILTTEKLVYNRLENVITCPEESVVKFPDGATLTVQDITLTGNLKEGVANAISMRLTDDALVEAAFMNRKKGGDRTVFRCARYTPCKFCAGENPLWEVNAKKVVLKNDEKEMVYQNSLLRLKGIPVFYVPYFSMPDASVKRKTGFLSPSFVHSSVMGTGLQTPFFINLTPHQNLFITPVVSLSHAPLGIVDYEGLLQKGTLKLQTSGTKDKDTTHDYVGHIRANFEYDITQQWRLTGDLFRVSEDTYFRRYNIPDIDDSQPFLTSHLTAERFGTRQYFSAKTLYFQSLNDLKTHTNVPYVTPLVNYYYQSMPFQNTSLYAFSNINTASVHNKHGFHSSRLSAEQGLRLPYMTRQGIGVDMMATVRGDGYDVDTGHFDFESLRANRHYQKGRFIPNISAMFNYPLATTTPTYTQILEPVVMLVYSDDTISDDVIPNVDSRDFDFDDTNLFSRNRFSGYDRTETGGRINYGLKWSLYGQNNHNISTLFGQSYQTKTDTESAPLMGVENHFSDYVGRMQIDYGILSLAYRFRLDQRDLSSQKNEFDLSAGTEKFYVGTAYSYIKETTSKDYSYPTREEIRLYGSTKLNRNWSLGGSWRYNLAKNGGPLEYDTSLRYDNECLAVAFDVKKSYAKDRDYSGDTSFTVKFILKTLGG